MSGLSKKAAAALELMKTGAYWRKQLETQFLGGEKFAYRLRHANGWVIKGFGFQTHYEMEKAGWLTSRVCAKSTMWPTEWVLKEEAQ